MKHILIVLTLLTSPIACCKTIQVNIPQNSSVAVKDTTSNTRVEAATINASVDDEVVIELKENPTTGYSWKIEEPESDIIATFENEYRAPAKNLIGAPGVRQLRIRAKGTGTITIIGEYRRPWENNTPPARRFTCEIIVK